MIRQKSKEWLRRYLPAEIVGTITAVSAAGITHVFYDNLVFLAYAGSIGEAIGFYSTVFIQNIIVVNLKNRIGGKTICISDFTEIISSVILEFGPAGIIDCLLLRPFFMFLFPILLKNFTIGILLGKIAGDITFYFLVILSYEMKKRYKKI